MDKSQSAANGRPAQKKRGSKGQKHKYRTAPDGVEYRRHALEGRIAQSALTSREEKVRQQQQQLQARRTQLIQTCRDKFREAAAAKAEGHRATMWANNLIFSELAGNKISKAIIDLIPNFSRHDRLKGRRWQFDGKISVTHEAGVDNLTFIVCWTVADQESCHVVNWFLSR